jgi:GntR family transcriptional regulator
MNQNSASQPAASSLGPGPSPLPLYRQVKQHLVRRVLEGEWKPGQSLPSEMRLAEEYGLSQGTVRKAIEEMAVEGLVSRQAGRGTFVTSYSGNRKPFRFHRLRAENGEKVAGDNVEFIFVRDGVRNARAAAGLGVDGQTDLTETLRVRDLDGTPALTERIFLPTAMLPGVRGHLEAEMPASIYLLLEKHYNALITRVEEQVRSRFPDAEEARLLRVDPKTPVLEVERVAYSLGGDILEWRIMTCETSRIHYSSNSD